MAQRKSGPLRDLRVVLLARQMAAKMTGMILADHGASVVELREAAFEPGRGWEIAEQVWTRGKMITPFEDGAQLDVLLDEAELFVTDWSMEALEQIDCAPKAALARHPTLVTVQISGYGATSVHQAEDWSEALVAASLGLPWAQEGRRGEAEPHMPNFMVGSAATAFNAVTGAMAGLHHRRRTGHGQVVDTSLVDGMAAQQTLGWAWAESIGSERRSPTNDIERGSLGRLVLKAFRCEDGGWIHVHTGAKGAFSRLVALAGLEAEIPPLPTSGQSEMGQPIEPRQLTLLH
jgi:crotonobetainyl-CoA:carnitine CoA-transferase CaiB-like acyl-CoA transferase